MEHHYIVCSSYYSYLGLVNKSLAHVTKIQKKRVDPASISLSLHWLTSLKKINIKPKLISGLNHLFFLLFWRITGSVQDTTVNMGNQFRKLAHKANVVYYRWRAEIKDTGAPTAVKGLTAWNCPTTSRSNLFASTLQLPAGSHGTFTTRRFWFLKGSCLSRWY